MRSGMRRKGSPPPGPPPRPLLQILGIASGVAIAVGGTIGAGIFRTPGVVAAELGEVRLILALWVFGGLVFLSGALSYAELGSRYPESGGLFNFIRRAYGDAAGFAYGWLFAAVIGPATAAALAVAFGEFTVRLTGAEDSLIRLLAPGAILVFGLTNYAGLRWGAGVQNLLTAAKVLGLGGLVMVAFLHPAAEGAGVPFEGANRSSVGLLAAFALAFQSVIFAFDGFNDPLKVGEEIREPERNLPRSLLSGVLVIAVVYLLVNAALLWAVPIESMARSNLPAGEAAVRLFGPSGDAVIAGLAIVSVLGTLNESLLVNPRIAFAMARQGLIFRGLRSVNEGGSPTGAIVWNAGLGLVVALSGTFDQLLALVAFALALGELAALGSLFLFRRRFPGTPAPFQVPGYPFVPALFFLVHLAFVLSLLLLRTGQAAIGLGVVAAALAVYPLWRRAGPRPPPQAEGRS
jgi:APA family basic amino acid/polyamine antiporter